MFVLVGPSVARRTASAERNDEAAIGERTQRVPLVVDAEVGVEVPARLAPFEGRLGDDMRCTTCMTPPSNTRYSAQVPGKSLVQPTSIDGTPERAIGRTRWRWVWPAA